MKNLSVSSFLSIFLLVTTSAFAGGDLVASFPLTVGKFVTAPELNIVYGSLPSDNSIAVIDMESLSITDMIQVGSMPAGLAISDDGSTLYVALSGAASIAVVDLFSKSVTRTIALPSAAFDLELGNGYLYATPKTQTTSGIMQISLTDFTLTSIFNESVFIYANGMLEVSPDKNTLYFGNAGLSPATLAAFDISTDTPSLIIKNPHGALGSNGQDLQISPDGNAIYFAVGSGNGITGGYDIGKLNTGTLTAEGAMITGPYPREITLASDGRLAYTAHTSGHIDVWDTETLLQISEYPTNGEAVELMADKTGNYLLAAFADHLDILTTESDIPIQDTDGDGVVDTVDNCPEVSNPNQSDMDDDGIGDICDPYPESANNLGNCLAEVDNLKALLELLQEQNQDLQNSLNTLLDSLDSDRDGISDLHDLCPNTKKGRKVDEHGCVIQ